VRAQTVEVKDIGIQSGFIRKQAAFNVLQFISTRRIPLLQIGNPGMYAFNVVADIQHYAGKEIKYQRETYCQKRGVNKEKPDLIDRDIKAFAQVGANPKRVSFKKSQYSL
jgi:hypothetical protein